MILEAYARIGDATPMAADCGLRCGAACCAPDEDGQGGMFLFPGEEALLSCADFCQVLPRGAFFAPIAVCAGRCDRALRPLACRIFPLTPVFEGDRLKVRLDARARAVCPLARGGLRGLKPDFVRAVLASLRQIARTQEGAAFLRAWQAAEEPFRHFSL